MSGVDEVDIVDTAFDKFNVVFPQTFDAHFTAKAAMGYRPVLTEPAAQRTTGEEDSAGTPCSADHRFLIVVGSSAGNHRIGTHATEARAIFAPQNPACART